MSTSKGKMEKENVKLNFITDLRKIGFVDKSDMQNGMAFRKDIPFTSLELCYYLQDDHIRLQSSGSGFSMELRGVSDLAGLDSFCKLLMNKSVLDFI